MTWKWRQQQVFTDNEIRNLAREGLLQDYVEENIQSVCYDLRARYYCTLEDHHRESCILKPGESIFVQCVEGINLPEDTVARVHLRNSRIRQGLTLDAPIYYPGHKTVVFFRITNLSNEAIHLKAYDEIASVTFERLSAAPEEVYRGTFQNEMEFSGLAGYTELFQADMEEIEQKKDDIRYIERNIYSNVIVIMTIFIGIFTLINVNVSLVSSAVISTSVFLIFNLATVGSIAFLAAVLRSFFSQNRQKNAAVWIITILAFAAAILIHLL